MPDVTTIRRFPIVAAYLACILSIAGPPVARAQSLGTQSILVGSAGGGLTVSLNIAIQAWTATSNSSFLHVSGTAAGTNSALISFTCDAFTGTGTRTGTLTIAGLNLAVTQLGTNFAAVSPVTTLVSSGLTTPSGVAVDSSGNVYIADTVNNAIKEWIASSGQVVTRVSAGLSNPNGVAVDGSGNIYIADTFNNAIKEEFAPCYCAVTPLVSSGLNHPFGVAVDVYGNVSIADTINGAMRQYLANIQQVATRVSSGLIGPLGVAVDLPGNVYIADTSNNAIKEWNANTGQVTTLVSSGLNRPAKVAVDGSGNLYIGDTFNNAIKKWSASTQQVTTLLSTGLLQPVGVAVDASGNVYLADSANNAIKKINIGFETLGMTAQAVGAAAGSGSVLVNFLPANSTAPWTASTTTSWLHITTASGAGSGIIQFAFDANMAGVPRAGTIMLDSGLTLAVTQVGINYTAVSPVTTLVSTGLSFPGGIAVDGAGNVYIADSGNSAIKEWSASTQQVTALATVSSGLDSPQGVAVDGAGNVYIADDGNNAIKEWISSTGLVTTLVSTGLSGPTGVAVDGTGNVYIADTNNNVIRKWNASTQQVATPPALSGGLFAPEGVAVDGAGNLYIADQGSSALEELSASTGQETTLLQERFLDPYVLAIDGAGNVYFVDARDFSVPNTTIKAWSASTGQTTVLVSSGLNTPQGVAVDGAGNVYISDSNNNTVKKLTAAFVSSASLTEPPTAGLDTLPVVIPASTALTGVFLPVSDQSWLTIGTAGSGIVNFTFTANSTGSPRTAHITILGQPVAVTQVAGTPPTADSVSPASGTGSSQVFTFHYSSANGSGYLTTVYSLINSSLSVTNGCWLYYVPVSNALYLYNDTGASVTGPLTPGSGSTLSNSQCTLNGSGSSASGSGNTLSLALSINFNPAFTGLKIVYGYASDNGGHASSWQTLGTWHSSTPASTPPTADSVSPASGTGSSQVFTFRYSSVNGSDYLSTVYGIINGSLSVVNGCYLYYDPVSNALYLYDDGGQVPSRPLTPGTGGTLSNSQCTLNGPGSSASGYGFGNTLSLALSITFKPAFTGLQNVYGYAIDKGASKSGWQTLGTWHNGTPLTTPPTADSVSPTSGSGNGQVFTFHYSSVNGSGYLSTVYGLINGSLNVVNGCWVYYVPASNALFLYNDSGTSSSGPLMPGSGGTLSNSQCTLNGSGSSAVGPGNTLTLALSLTFNPAFTGLHVYGYASDNGGHASGWQTLGTWNSAAPLSTPPTADSVSPVSGIGTTQILTFQYSSVNGNGYLSTVYGLINTSLSVTNGCWVYYVPASNALYLYNDAGSSPSGPLTPGSGGTLSNSQCTLNGNGSSASGSGNTLSLALSLAFTPAFTGLHVHGYASDNGGHASGWQALGTWNSAAPLSTPPTADSVSPASGTGTSQVFTFKYSSVNGSGYLETVYILLNGSLNVVNGCFVSYVPASAALYLYNDTGTSASGPLTPGGGGTLSNSQCALNGSGSSASGSGNTLSLSLSINFKPAFTALQSVYGYAIDNGAHASGWQTLGTWNSAP